MLVMNQGENGTRRQIGQADCPILSNNNGLFRQWGHKVRMISGFIGDCWGHKEVEPKWLIIEATFIYCWWENWKKFPLDLNYSLVKNCAETTTWCNTATSGSGQLNSEHEVLDHYAEMDWLMVLSLITFELKIWLRLNWRCQVNSDIVPVMFPID